MVSNISVDSTIVAAVVSAIISISILLISSYFIQPRKLRRNWGVEHLEKRIEVYGALNTLLDSMLVKAERVPADLPAKKRGYTFQMENPFDYNRLLAIVERKNYLFSKEISESWFKVLKDDKHFHIFNSLKEGSMLTLANFSEMQQITKKEYSELKTQYEKLTGIKIS